MTPAQILTDAAALIETHGQCTDGRYRDDEGRLCAIGAMRQVVFGDAMNYGFDYRGAEGDRLAYVIGKEALSRRLTTTIAQWNDSHPQAEVVAELRAAAAELERTGAAS